MQNKVLFFYILFLFSSQRSGISTAGLAATEENSYLRNLNRNALPDMAADHSIRKLLRPLILLAVFAAAWTGKSFDLHTPEFYHSQRIETISETCPESPAREQVCAYCPICHFEFYYFEPADQPLCFTPCTFLLGDAPRLALRRTAAAPVERRSPRAPPAVLIG